jgi:hypothetical protein
MSEPPEENESMTTVPSEPTTKAGRDLLRYTKGLPDLFQTPTWEQGVLAIEAEARADALDVEALAEVLARQRLTTLVGEPRKKPDYLDRQTAALIAAEYRAILAERQP